MSAFDIFFFKEILADLFFFCLFHVYNPYEKRGCVCECIQVVNIFKVTKKGIINITGVKQSEQLFKMIQNS